MLMSPLRGLPCSLGMGWHCTVLFSTIGWSSLREGQPQYESDVARQVAAGAVHQPCTHSGGDPSDPFSWLPYSES